MAKKLEKIENYIVVTDTVTSVVEVNHPASDTSFQLGTNTINLHDISTGGTLLNQYSFSNIVGSTGTAFVPYFKTRSQPLTLVDVATNDNVVSLLEGKSGNDRLSASSIKFTKKRLIGAIYNDSSSNIRRFYMSG